MNMCTLPPHYYYNNYYTIIVISEVGLLTAEDAQNTEDVAATDPLSNPPVALLQDYNGECLQEAPWPTVFKFNFCHKCV